MLVFVILILIVSVPAAFGHPQIVGTSPGEFNPHAHIVEPKENFISSLITIIVVVMLCSVVMVYSRDIARLIKKD
jgi:hypothetical protein